jgi:hypothetical protein
MATVPIVNQSVAVRPATPVYQSAAGASLDAFGGLQAQSTQQGGQRLAQAGERLDMLAEQRLREDNVKAAKDGDISLAEQIRTITRGDGTEANPGYYGSRGDAATEGFASTEKAVSEAHRKISEGITSPEARRLYDLQARERLNLTFEKMGEHQQTQRRIALDTTSEARIGEALDDAKAYWNDPRTLAQSLAVARGEVNSMTQRNGWSPEVTVSKMGEAQTAIYRGAITAAMQTDPMAAQKLYNDNKDKIDGRVRPDIEKMLEGGVLRQQSQQEADRIMAMPGLSDGQRRDMAKQLTNAKLRDETMQRIEHEASVKQTYSDRERADAATELSDRILRAAPSEAAAVDEVSRIKDGKLRSAVNGLVQGHYSQQDRINKSLAKDAAPEAVKQILEKGGGDQVMREAALALKDRELSQETLRLVEHEISQRKSIQTAAVQAKAGELMSYVNNGGRINTWANNNPDAFNLVVSNGPVYQNIQNAEKNYAEGRMFAGVTDAKTLPSLQQMPVEQLAKADLEMYRPLLTKAEFDKAATLKAGAQARMDNVDQNRAVFSAGESALKNYSPKIKANGKEKPKLTDAQMNAANNEMTAFISGYTKQGKLPTQEQINSEAVRLMLEVTADPSNSGFLSLLPQEGQQSFTGIIGQLREMSPEQRAVARVPVKSIPKPMLDDIKSEIATAGLKSDNDLIEQIAGAMATNNKERARTLLGIK